MAGANILGIFFCQYRDTSVASRVVPLARKGAWERQPFPDWARPITKWMTCETRASTRSSVLRRYCARSELLFAYRKGGCSRNSSCLLKGALLSRPAVSCHHQMGGKQSRNSSPFSSGAPPLDGTDFRARSLPLLSITFACGRETERDNPSRRGRMKGVSAVDSVVLPLEVPPLIKRSRCSVGPR